MSGPGGPKRESALGEEVAQRLGGSPVNAQLEIQLKHVYDAIVDVDVPRFLGEGPLGERRLITIAGGEFHGPGLAGRVLPGGADRQCVLGDGVRWLDALYEMETDDGAVLTVRNRVKVIERPGLPREAFSQLEVTAPVGPYGWLNDAVLVGTMKPLLPERHAVLIRVYRLVQGGPGERL